MEVHGSECRLLPPHDGSPLPSPPTDGREFGDQLPELHVRRHRSFLHSEPHWLPVGPGIRQARTFNTSMITCKYNMSEKNIASEHSKREDIYRDS